MIAAESKGSRVLLIECASQHPLKPDGTPGEEFQARLDRAIKIYKKYRDDGWQVNIYVPGSLHQIKNRQGIYDVDLIPLCESGKQYLINNEVDAGDILGQEANERYKGKAGVYCSADECYVSSNLFLDGNYQRFIVICSPAQAMRKTLYYLLSKTLPIIYTEAPQTHCATTFHNYAYEAIKSIPEIIASMDDMQGENCCKAIAIREDRDPYYSSH